jgi:hypothetical protein
MPHSTRRSWLLYGVAIGCVVDAYLLSLWFRDGKAGLLGAGILELRTLAAVLSVPLSPVSNFVVERLAARWPNGSSWASILVTPPLNWGLVGYLVGAYLGRGPQSPSSRISAPSQIGPSR